MIENIRLYADSVKKQTLKMYEGKGWNSVSSKVLLESTEDNPGCFQLEYFSGETLVQSQIFMIPIAIDLILKSQPHRHNSLFSVSQFSKQCV